VHILLHVPDNQITNNFLPQLWPFLLKNLTPKEHRVTIIDGNVVKWDEREIVQFVRTQAVDLVGMGFMTRMAQKAYRLGRAIRTETEVPVVFGGPHVTAVPEEALGRTGEPQCADSVVLGEADQLWPVVVEDVAQGRLRPIYRAGEGGAPSGKPSLEDYPILRWDEVDLTLFNLMRCVPSGIRRLLKVMSVPYERAYLFPVESGRGCPYGCDFCTVTGFFGDHLRFRSNESVITELLQIKAIAERDKALVMVFFIDDNLAVNRRRLKSLLREMIQRDACLPWVGQISINLLQDEELVQLIAATGGRYIFVGLESLEPESLAAAGKRCNRPEEYRNTLQLLARNNVYAITSFIVGLEGDRRGISSRIAEEMATWPPGLPVFGLLTPFPATPLYARLESEKRLTRPKHWLDFHPFEITFSPQHLSRVEAHDEVQNSWQSAYRPSAFRRTQKWMLENRKPFAQQLTLFISRLLFRGIYFPQMTRWSWVRLLSENILTIGSLVTSAFDRQIGDTQPRRLPLPPVPVRRDEPGWSPES
jgi:radical SAM superfamily enzyme YgiQ (UPF0313 family)